MAKRTTAPRYPDWFVPSDGQYETYPLYFPELTKFDNFKMVVSRRNQSIPFSVYQRVGIDIWDYPSFGEAPFIDRLKNPHIAYGIPDGRPWKEYVQQAIAQNQIGSVGELSAPSLSPSAQNVINHLADNLEDINYDLILDQREESGFSDTSLAYKRVAERVAQRITQRVANEKLTFRPIFAGGYIFFANSDPAFWQADIGGDVDKTRPLRFEKFFDGEGWRDYNPYFQQERWRFMDQNAGAYFWGPNHVDCTYQVLNGIFHRINAYSKLRALTDYDPRDVLFTWDKCDPHAGAFATQMELRTTSPAGRVMVKARMNPPIEWMRLLGWIAPVVKDGFAVWNEPITPIYDRNWIQDDPENDLSKNCFYPDGGGNPTRYPKAVNTQQAQARPLLGQGMIDFNILGCRQGYEVRRALGGRAISAKFIPYRIDGGSWVDVRGNLSDSLYGAAERRGLMMELIGQSGKKAYAYWNGYGDLRPHSFDVRPSSGPEDSFVGLGNGLSYTDPF